MARDILITNHGQVLVDTSEGLRAIHVSVLKNEDMLCYDTKGDRLFMRGCPQELYFKDGLAFTCNTSKDSHGLMTETTEGKLRFSRMQTFLSAAPDGRLFLTHLSEAWERFLPVSAAFLDYIRIVLRHGLFSKSLNTFIAPQDITIVNFEIAYGGFTFPMQVNLDIDARNEANLLLSDNLNVESSMHYNPVLYVCAFGDQSSFRLAELSLASFVRHSGIDFDFIIFTDIDAKIENPDLSNLEGKIQIIQKRCLSHLDKLYSRYEVTQWPALQHAQPIIYADIDVICNAPLKNLVNAAFRSDKVSCNIEEVSIEERLPFFISDFLDRDPTINATSVIAVNSGVFACRNAMKIGPAVQAIKKVADNIGKYHPVQSIFSFDQPVFNYCLMKLDMRDDSSIREYICNWPQEDYDAIPRNGLVHFCGWVGEFGGKYMRIERYLEWLESSIFDDNSLA